MRGMLVRRANAMSILFASNYSSHWLGKASGFALVYSDVWPQQREMEILLGRSCFVGHAAWQSRLMWVILVTLVT